MMKTNRIYPIEDLPNKSKMPSRSRKNNHQPLGIVIHSMAQYLIHNGEKMFAPDFLHAIGLSAHAYIDVDGTQVKGVITNRVAYHAGKSYWDGYRGLNNRWLGIEVLVEGTHDWSSFSKEIMHNKNIFTNDQYKSTSILCKDWMKKYPSIKKEYILGHSEVSGRNVRSDPKIDPGDSWDWDSFWKWFNLVNNPISTKKINPITL